MALRDLVSQRVLEDILGKLHKAGQWKALVLDHTSTRIISSCCRMHEIMNKGITIVESLEKEREPLPHMEAVYIMRPTEENISRLCADFQRPVEPKGLYKAIHVFFLQKCPPSVFTMLSRSEASKRIQTLQEANIAFLPYESRAFTLDYPESFESYYTNDFMKKDDLFDMFADQLATVCALLGEYPSIRAWNDGENRCRQLAAKLQDKLDAFKADKADLGKGPKQNSEFIILDRGFDVVTPVIHEATFQCMVFDYLKPDNNVYKYQAAVGDGQTKQKDVILDENDELWKKWRHGHIADVSKEVSQSLKDFSKKKKLGDPKNPDISVKALARHIKRAPQYQKELGQYSLHLDLVSKCMGNYKKELFEVEQALATGLDNNGDPIQDPLTLLNPFIFGRKYSVYDKLRLQILYTLQKKGLTQDEFSTMIQQSEIPNAERPIIPNLMHLGIPVIKGESVKQGRSIERKQRAETTYTDSRYSPLLRDILEYVIEGKLSEDYCPYTKGKPRGSTKSSFTSSGATGGGSSSSSSSSSGGATTSVRKQYDWIKSDKKSKPARGATGGATAASTIAARDLPTIFVFIIGGATYSELRTIYRIAEENKNYDFLIGTTHVVTQADFLGQVKRLPVRMRV